MILRQAINRYEEFFLYLLKEQHFGLYNVSCNRYSGNVRFVVNIRHFFTLSEDLLKQKSSESVFFPQNYLYSRAIAIAAFRNFVSVINEKS